MAVVGDAKRWAHENSIPRDRSIDGHVVVKYRIQVLAATLQCQHIPYLRVDVISRCTITAASRCEGRHKPTPSPRIFLRPPRLARSQSDRRSGMFTCAESHRALST